MKKSTPTHPSFLPIQQAAAAKEIHKPADIARALGVTPQVIANWQRRGVPPEGVLLAQEFLGMPPVAVPRPVIGPLSIDAQLLAREFDLAPGDQRHKLMLLKQCLEILCPYAPAAGPLHTPVHAETVQTTGARIPT